MTVNNGGNRAGASTSAYSIMPPSKLPPDLDDVFVASADGPVTIVARRAESAALRSAGLLGSAAMQDGALRPAGGRGGAWIATTETGDVVVRPGRRGGWFGRLVRSRYFRGDRFVEELLLTERLRRAGVPVPEPLAAVRRARPLGYETWLVTRFIPASRPAAVRLGNAHASELEELLTAIGRAVRTLHDAGGEHADLNAWNILIREPGADSAPTAHLIDFDRGRLRAPPLEASRAGANVARLRRSLSKLELSAALDAWQSFDRGYAAPSLPAPPAGAGGFSS